MADAVALFGMAFRGFFRCFREGCRGGFVFFLGVVFAVFRLDGDDLELAALLAAVRAVATEKRATEMMSPRCLERFICRHGVSSDACSHGLFARFHVVVAGKPVPPPPPWVAF